MQESIIYPPTGIRIEDSYERAQTADDKNVAMIKHKSAVVVRSTEEFKGNFRMGGLRNTFTEF